jgi:hypothetical protein
LALRFTLSGLIHMLLVPAILMFLVWMILTADQRVPPPEGGSWMRRKESPMPRRARR